MSSASIRGLAAQQSYRSDHLAAVTHVSTSSFSDSSALYKGLSGSGVVGLSSGRLNVTDFVGRVSGLVVGLALSLSDPSESYRVLLPIESSSWGRYGVGSGFRSLWNLLTQVRVGCLPLHSSHRLKTLMSLFSVWLA